MNNRERKVPSAVEQQIVQDYTQCHMGSATLSIKYGYSTYTILKVLKGNNVSVRDNRQKSLRYSCNEHYFDCIDTEEKAYWLGFILADGHVRKSPQAVLCIALKAEDESHLEKFRTSINANHKIAHYSSKNVFGGINEYPYCRISITSPVLVQRLISLGVVEKKSNIALPPHEVPEHLVRHCMRGYFDGNGSVSIHHSNHQQRPIYKFRLTGTEDILRWFTEYFRQCNIDVRDKFNKRYNDLIVSDIEIGGNRKAQSVLDLLYQHACIYLDRKYQRYQELCELNTVPPIRKNG